MKRMRNVTESLLDARRPTYQPTGCRRSCSFWAAIQHRQRLGRSTPDASCRQNSDYDDMDLTEIADDFLPRAVYPPGNALVILQLSKQPLTNGQSQAFQDFGLSLRRKERHGRCCATRQCDIMASTWHQPGACTARQFASFRTLLRAPSLMPFAGYRPAKYYRRLPSFLRSLAASGCSGYAITQTS